MLLCHLLLSLRGVDLLLCNVFLLLPLGIFFSVSQIVSCTFELTSTRLRFTFFKAAFKGIV